MAREYRQNASYSEILNDGEGEQEQPKTSAFATRLPFGLCKKYGIPIQDSWTPRDAWNALKGKGITHQQIWADIKKDGQGQEQGEQPQVQTSKQPTGKATSVKEAKDFDELETYLKDAYGVTVDSKVKDLDFDQAREALSGFEHILNEFPKAKQYFKSVKVHTGKGVASMSPSGDFSFNYTNFKNGSTYARDSMSQYTGFHPKGNNLYTTGSHEAGHLLEIALIKSSNFQFGIQEILAWNDCTCAKQVVRQAQATVKKATKKLYNAQWQEVSGYANTEKYGYSECMAECVADYVANGENAAPLSREVWKILKARLS